MKRVAYFIFTFSFFIFLLAITSFFFNSRLIEERILYSSVNVSDSAGFDLNSEVLSFGKIAPGGSSSRNVIFQNTYSFPIIIEISVSGNIAELLIYESRLKAEKGEIKKIPFSVVASPDIEKGAYFGNVTFRVFG